MTSPNAAAVPVTESTTSSIVSVRNVHKTYPGGVEALNNI